MDEAVKNLTMMLLACLALAHLPAAAQPLQDPTRRSEERRVGKECPV